MKIIQRNIFPDIIKWLDNDRIIIIKGARRVGKTTLLNQLKDYIEKKNYNVVMFSADQEFDNPIFQNSKVFYKFLCDQYLESEKKLYVFIDECQYLPNAPIFLKTFYDIAQGKVKLIVTGSSILELLKSKEAFTGRKIEFELERFSFSEYLSFASEYKYSKQFNLYTNFESLKELYEIYKKDLKYNFLEYINWGGYPEVCTERNISRKKVYLKEIIKTYIEKDIAQFFHIENILKFNNLIRILCHQKAQLLNRSEVANTIGIHLRTLEKYLDLLQGTFIITLLQPFFANIRKEISKMPKIFINDTGIIKYYTNFELYEYELIDGLLIENFIFTQIKNKNIELNFYRTISKSEIDFIIRTENGLIPAEVKFRKKVSIPVSIKNFLKNYSSKQKKAIIFTQDYIAKKDNIFFVPVVLADFIIY